MLPIYTGVLPVRCWNAAHFYKKFKSRTKQNVQMWEKSAQNLNKTKRNRKSQRHRTFTYFLLEFLLLSSTDHIPSASPLSDATELFLSSMQPDRLSVTFDDTQSFDVTCVSVCVCVSVGVGGSCGCFHSARLGDFFLTS